MNSLQSEPKPGAIRRLFRFFARMASPAAHAAAVLVFVGGVVRLTLRDAVPLLSTFFYALPTGLLVILSVFAALLFLLKGQGRRSALLWVTATGCLVWWYQTSFVWNAGTSSPHAMRVMFWNPAWGNTGWEGMAAEIHARDPLLVGLVEAGRNNEETHQRYADLFPDYQRVVFGRGFVFLSKHEIVNIGQSDLAGGGRFVRVDLKIDARVVTMILVDIESNPLQSRRAAFEALTTMLAGLPERPVLLMGDFNTPADSVFFDPIRAGFQNVFETAGSGLKGTWPAILPVLDIDQLWVSSEVTVHTSRLGWSWRSDHRPVVTEISIDSQ